MEIRLTLEQKLRLLVGMNRWQTSDLGGALPVVTVADGPHGVRKEVDDNGVVATVPSTAYPAISVLASSWNAQLVRATGRAIADDCIERGVDVLLAPGVNLKRSPLCGRNFEYFSEDPILSGSLGRAYIEGVQEGGIGTALKHFCANNREYNRNFQSSEIDERTLRELYLRPFELALKANPRSVMCSYNPVNGVLACQNEKLLKGYLRGDFGYRGLVMSDWNSVRDRAAALRATCDLEMPYVEASLANLQAAYRSGELGDEEIDESVARILAFLEQNESEKAHRKVSLSKAERRAIALQGAEEGIVLLKNEGGVLPLRDGESLLVAGSLSERPLLGGGGSSLVRSDAQPAALHRKLQALLPHSEIEYLATTAYPKVVYGPNLAFESAFCRDAAVVYVGNDASVEGEGFDRDGLRLCAAFEQLILGVAAQNPRTVVVLASGSAVDMTPWIDRVAAVVWAGFSGEAVNEALADILAGKTCPSGKLAETFPLRVEDTPTGLACGNGFYERYTEGVFVGYRYYDAFDKDVLFPFGHGLSYAQFVYSDLALARAEDRVVVSYTLRNVSATDGREISQLYVRDVHASVSRPPKELKAFRKDEIPAGGSARVSLELTPMDFAYWSPVYDTWIVEPGQFEILIGSSSRDIRLRAPFRIDTFAKLSR